MARRRHVCYSFIFPFVNKTDDTMQVTSCKGMFDNGFPLPTHRRTRTLFGKRTTLELPRGSLIVMD